VLHFVVELRNGLLQISKPQAVRRRALVELSRVDFEVHDPWHLERSAMVRR